MKPLQGVGAIVSGALKPITGTLGFAGGVVSGFVGTLTGPLVSGLQKAAAAGERAFGGLSQTVLTWVRAGLQGTTTGEQLGVQFQLLSREVANLMIGPMDALISGVSRITNWFRSLDGSTQRQLGSLLAWGVGLYAASGALAKLAGGLSAVNGLFKLFATNPLVAIVAAIAAAVIQSKGLGGVLESLLGVMGKIATAVETVFGWLGRAIDRVGELASSVASRVGGFLEGVDQKLFGGFFGRLKDRAGEILADIGDALGLTGGGPATQPGQDRQELVSKGGGIEDVRAAFARFNAAAQRTDVPQRQLDALQRIEQNTRRGGGSLVGAGLAAAVPAVSES